MTPIAQQLQVFRFNELFNQLGWGGLSVGIEKEVGNEVFTLRPVAQKRDIQILHCSPDSEGVIPSYAIVFGVRVMPFQFATQCVTN